MPSLKPVFGTAWGRGKWQSPKTVGMTGKVQEKNRQESKRENFSCPLSLQSLSVTLETEIHMERKISKIASMHPGQPCSNLLQQSQTIVSFSHQCLQTWTLSPLLYLLHPLPPHWAQEGCGSPRIIFQIHPNCSINYPLALTWGTSFYLLQQVNWSINFLSFVVPYALLVLPTQEIWRWWLVVDKYFGLGY